MLNIGQTHTLLSLLDGPGERLPKRLTCDRTTGLADGHQAHMSPIERAVVLQLAHQSAVHHHDEIHVPGLAHSVTQLTLAHAQMLLSVPVVGLRPSPASLVDLQDTMGFPMDAIGDQHLARLFGVGGLPQHQQTHWMVDFWEANSLCEIPLGMTADRKFGAHERAKRRDPRAHRRILSADRDSAIELQVANVATAVPLDMVHNRPVGEIAIEGEVARNTFSDDPINQLLRQGGMVLERMRGIALLTLAEAPEVERIVLA